MGHIFISYSHNDKEYVHKLQEALLSQGFNVWIDDRIDYGTRWPKVIQDHLDGCDAFIVIVSENSFESEWVQNEVTRAKRIGKPFLLRAQRPRNGEQGGSPNRIYFHDTVSSLVWLRIQPTC